MFSDGRKYKLEIWGLALGYFVAYLPYSALVKLTTSGRWPGMTGAVSGFELLPVTVVATLVGMGGFLLATGWWRHAGRRALWRLQVPVPQLLLVLSGVGFALQIATTTLAYSFPGVSIVLALLL